MKSVVFLVTLFCTSLLTAQNFSKEWKEIYQLEKEGSYKTLKTNVDALYKKAHQSKNEAEKAKAVLFQMKLENVLEETNYQKKVDRLQKELADSKGIYKEVYRWYYIKTILSAYDSKQSYWRRNSLVTATTAELPKDIDLWSKEQYQQVVLEEAELLFKEESLLKQTKVSAIKDLIDYDYIDNNLNQSVYEFFAINFINDYAYNSYLVRPLQEEFNSFDASFSQQKIVFPPKSDDLKSELGKKAIELFQKLEQHYIATNQNKALDKIRYLRFEKFADDQSAEGTAFQDLGKNLSTNFYKNRWYADYAIKLSKEANKTDKKDYYERSLKAIAEVKKNKHENDQLENVQLLENDIKQKEFSVSLKKEVYEGEPAKYRIDYKNIDSVHLAYYDFSKHAVLNDSVYQLVVKNQQPLKIISHVLPKDLPYFQTSTEILGAQFPLGTYLLVAYSETKDLESFHYQRINTFQTTNVSIFTKNIDNETSALYVVHPKTGKPYEKVVVRFKNKSFVTDELGKIIVPNKTEYGTDNTVAVYLKNETYKTNLYVDSYGQYISIQNVKREAKIDLFTDRTIYRPGQEVHFKGILYLKEKQGNSVLVNKSFQAILEDDNGDEINKITLTTNELGGFSGTFLLPKSIATGEFSISIEELDEYADENEEQFWKDILFPDETFDYRVEEYKRPTFDVELEAIKYNVYFDEKVTIKGKANSLAGGAIANAKVKLRINSSYYDNETYQSKKIIDIQEELLTNEQGAFEYTFTIPSDSIGNILKEKIITNYVNYFIEVTDTAGEVREYDRRFTVANTNHRLSIYKYNTAKTDEPLNVSIKSFTHNNEFSPVTGTVKIYQTLPNSTFYGNRPWSLPELTSIDETTFRKLFPYETYTEKDNEPLERKLVYEGTYTTQKDKDFELDIKNWKTGAYQLAFEILDEKSGLSVKSSTNFDIKNAEEKLATNKNVAVTNHSKSNKNQLILETNSLYDNVWLYVEYFDRDATVQSKQFLVKKGSQLIKIPLANSTENETISYNWFFMKEQQLYSDKGSYTIEQEKKEDEKWLVEWQSWNDKLNPAQQYQWKLLLKNAKTNKAFQGEFLASMYDASLDLLIDEWDRDEKSWITNSQKLNDYTYVSFSSPEKKDMIQHNYLYGSDFGASNIHFYWNTWNYFGYNFSNRTNYTDYYSQLPVDILNNTADFYQIEVRDEKTEAFISNAMIFNFKNANQTTTNEDGFAKVLGEKSQLIGVVALGYEEQRLELKKGLTVIHLHPKEGGISEISYNRLNEQIKIFDRIYKYYIERVEGFSDILDDEKIFTNKVLQYDKSIEVDVTIPEQIISDGVIKEITGIVRTQDGEPIPGATVMKLGSNIESDTDDNGIYRFKASNGDLIQATYEGFKSERRYVQDSNVLNFILIEDESGVLNDIVVDTYRTVSKSQSAVAASTTTSTTTYGVQSVEDAHKEIPLRKNLNETAFFYPHLQTNDKGEIVIDFTAPEALTQWKFRGLAHNKSTDYIYIETLSRTQKDVMIQPNMPRFVREIDEIVLKARVSNTTAQPLNATAMLRLFNTITGEDLSAQIIKTEALVPVIIEGLSANTVSWTVQIPKNIEGLQYRISVQSGNFTDGEESVIPVLSNRQLVTETVPIWQLANENKTYQLTNLLENASATLENHQLRIDVSNNATWLMMQSLSYLLDYPHQCSEQLFARYFANVIASNVLENNPSIQQLVKEWKENPKSKLEENEELKEILLQETPWMKDLVSDEEQKAQFAHYFDVNRLDDEAQKIEDLLTERQMPSGALPWFSGGNENPYITAHILVTIAQLKNLGIRNPFLNNTEGFINKAHRYLDVQFEKKFQNKQELSFSEVIDYAFVKSYYKDSFAVSKENQARIDRRLEALKKDWVKLPLYDKARLILVLHRKDESNWAKKIINQLEESSVIDETYGMYWKENLSENYYYYNAAEVQALIIEAYKETEMPQEKIQRLNVWLLSQKLQTDWGTTKATTQSLYALILGQQDVNLEQGSIQIQAGNEKINISKATETEQQIGNYSYRWTGEEVKPSMGKIEVKNTTSQPVFGGVYWQYFEDMSTIKNSQDGLLNISRNYYIENKEGKWDLVTAETKLILGQKVKVRIEIEATRDMSFVHIKDVRPATFEPVDVLSGYHYKNGLGYYQSTRDAATHFFVDMLTKGKYVLEYEVRLNNIGTFTSGISTIQSMYAPEHSGHSDGTIVKVKE